MPESHAGAWRLSEKNCGSIEDICLSSTIPAPSNSSSPVLGPFLFYSSIHFPPPTMPTWEESAPDPRMTNQGSLQGGPETNENSTLGFLSLESRLLQTLMCTGFTQGVDFQDLPQESDAEALRWGMGICCYHTYRTTRPVQSPRVRKEEKALQSYTASRKLRRSSPSST